MLYNLIQTRRGKDTIYATDTLPKINKRLRTLRSSGKKIKGEKVEYRIEPSDDNNKFYKKPHSYNVSGDGRHYSQPKRK